MTASEYVYRSGKLRVAVSGDPGPDPDVNVINENLLKQNICLACYSSTKNLDELTDMLGVPKAYIEFDLKWLVEREFVKEQKGKYLTLFSIDNKRFHMLLKKIYVENRTMFSDVIIEKMIFYEKQIRSIGFYGSEKPMNKLLWLLLYKFNDYVFYKTSEKYNFDFPIRLDGGRYFPLGFNQSENQEGIDWNEYPDLFLGFNGGMTSRDGMFNWVGLYNFMDYNITKIFEYKTNESCRLSDMLIRAIKPDFSIDALTEEEKSTLSEIFSYGWLTNNSGSINANFYIFKRDQDVELNKIFDVIYDNLKESIDMMLDNFENLCKSSFPAHLQNNLNYYIRMAMYDNVFYTAMFGLLDGKLFKPVNSDDGGLLTFRMIVD